MKKKILQIVAKSSNVTINHYYNGVLCLNYSGQDKSIKNQLEQIQSSYEIKINDSELERYLSEKGIGKNIGVFHFLEQGKFTLVENKEKAVA